VAKRSADGSTGRPTSAGAYLSIAGPNVQAQSALPLDQRVVRIGREEDSHVWLGMDDKASRRHALLESTHGQWSIRDCGSSNGTFLNGLRLGTAAGNGVLRCGERKGIAVLGVLCPGWPADPRLACLAPE